MMFSILKKTMEVNSSIALQLLTITSVDGPLPWVFRCQGDSLNPDCGTIEKREWIQAPGRAALTQVWMEIVKEFPVSVSSAPNCSYRTKISHMWPVSICSSCHLCGLSSIYVFRYYLIPEWSLEDPGPDMLG